MWVRYKFCSSEDEKGKDAVQECIADERPSPFNNYFLYWIFVAISGSFMCFSEFKNVKNIKNIYKKIILALKAYLNLCYCPLGSNTHCGKSV